MRRKPTLAAQAITNMDEATEAMRRLAELGRELEIVQTSMNERIDAVKTEAKAMAAPLDAEVESLGRALGDYATLNKSELFASRRSVETAFGTFGFRLATRLCLLRKSLTWEMVLGRLKELGRAVRTKEEVDKEELARWADAELEAVGVARKQSDAFYFDTKSEKLQDAA